MLYLVCADQIRSNVMNLPFSGLLLIERMQYMIIGSLVLVAARQWLTIILL